MSDSDQDSGSEEDGLPSVDAADDDDEITSFEGDAGFPSDEDAADDDVLQQDDIDDLFGVAMEDSRPTTGLEALLNSAHVEHKRMPLLEACIDRLVRALKKSMRNFISNNIELSLSETSSIRFGNYVEAIPLPALISVFKIKEWNNYGLINVDSPLIYSTLDSLLGGRGSASTLAVEGRSFTSIEVALIERLVDLVLKEMTDAFQPLAAIEFCRERMESNPSLATIAYPADTGILFKIDIDMDNRGGRLEIMIPYPTLEPVSHLLQQMFMGDKFGHDSIWETHWASEMLLSDIELEASLGEEMVSLNDIMSWEVGSTLQMRKNPQDLVTLRCGDTHLLRGKVGRLGDRMAIQVEDWIPMEKSSS